jgi:hypothetical protein
MHGIRWRSIVRTDTCNLSASSRFVSQGSTREGASSFLTGDIRALATHPVTASRCHRLLRHTKPRNSYASAIAALLSPRQKSLSRRPTFSASTCLDLPPLSLLPPSSYLVPNPLARPPHLGFHNLRPSRSRPRSDTWWAGGVGTWAGPFRLLASQITPDGPSGVKSGFSARFQEAEFVPRARISLTSSTPLSRRNHVRPRFTRTSLRRTLASLLSRPHLPSRAFRCHTPLDESPSQSSTSHPLSSHSNLAASRLSPTQRSHCRPRSHHIVVGAGSAMAERRIWLPA